MQNQKPMTRQEQEDAAYAQYAAQQKQEKDQTWEKHERQA